MQPVCTTRFSHMRSTRDNSTCSWSKNVRITKLHNENCSTRVVYFTLNQCVLVSLKFVNVRNISWVRCYGTRSPVSHYELGWSPDSVDSGRLRDIGDKSVKSMCANAPQRRSQIYSPELAQLNTSSFPHTHKTTAKLNNTALLQNVFRKISTFSPSRNPSAVSLSHGLPANADIDSATLLLEAHRTFNFCSSHL